MSAGFPNFQREFFHEIWPRPKLTTSLIFPLSISTLENYNFLYSLVIPHYCCRLFENLNVDAPEVLNSATQINQDQPVCPLRHHNRMCALRVKRLSPHPSSASQSGHRRKSNEPTELQIQRGCCVDGPHEKPPTRTSYVSFSVLVFSSILLITTCLKHKCSAATCPITTWGSVHAGREADRHP